MLSGAWYYEWTLFEKMTMIFSLDVFDTWNYNTRCNALLSVKCLVQRKHPTFVYLYFQQYLEWIWDMLDIYRDFIPAKNSFGLQISISNHVLLLNYWKFSCFVGGLVSKSVCIYLLWNIWRRILNYFVT